jgi:hypothetical protein
MALLYNVKIKTFDREKKSITVIMENIHPDAIYFSDNLGFAIRLMYDSTLGDSNLAKAIDHNCLLNKDWMQNNVKAFISSSKLLQILIPNGAEIIQNGTYSFWRGDMKQAVALLEINFTSENWFHHLTIDSNWKSTAYDLQVDYKSFENSSINTGESFSMDYENSGGWLLMPTKDFFDKNINIPSQVYVPKYSLKSYRKANKFSAKDINSDLMTNLLFKTVYILTRKTEKAFGVLLPYEDKFCVINIRKNGSSRVFFTISELFTISESEFNQNDSFLVNVFE